jgi:hypothetical protein
MDAAFTVFSGTMVATAAGESRLVEVVARPMVNSYSQIHRGSRGRADSVAGIAKLVRRAIGAILIWFAIGICGCTNTQIGAAREEMAKGDYAAAHERFVAASHSPKLTAFEWRELEDGLCLTEVKIGKPQYSLDEQRRRCATAASRPGSSSGPILARIDSAERVATDAKVDSALRSGDIAGAEAAVVRYQSFPGADQHAIAEWSKQIWSTLDRQESLTKYHSRHLVPAIAAVSRRYPKMRAMNDTAFRRWVMNNATVSREALVERIDLHGSAIDLAITSSNLPAVALNLDRFARINDAMVARCRCDGRTNIAVEGSGLPAYLLRLDPDTKRSEVLVMPQPH